MGSRPEYLRLCRLVDETIHPFSDLAADCLNEAVEKDLLIALSQVFRQVKQWTHEFDSDEELLSPPLEDGKYLAATASHLDNHHCFAKIIGDLMFLLAFNSQYTQHLLGNILVAISEFLLTLDVHWEDFMHLLCFCLELAMHNSLTTLSESPSKTRYLDYVPSTSKSLLKPKLKNANWFVVAAIFRVLCNIQKNLKQYFDENFIKAYLDSVTSLISNLPWDVLRKLYVDHNTEALTMFLGSFIQFLCSVVAQCSFLEDNVSISPILSKIANLVPKITAWCHPELQSCHHVRISHYFRHKVLMLMVKLSSSNLIKPPILITWIHLLHKHFEDLFLQPISGVKFDEDACLEGSPFCTSISDPGKQNMSPRHLQRLAIFLFLKCSLNLVSAKGSPDEPKCVYENLKHYCNDDLDLDSECSSKSIGLVELNKWLEAQVPADILVNNEIYFEGCLRFTLSFLQLFMHEDDILFEMLLQLFRAPFYPDQRRINKEEPLDKANFLASDLFNPIHLFHLFLAEIHYDHQVLLDYLISKDTGSTCAEYLLRSLRIVCNSWILFVEFPGVEEGFNQFRIKRQTVLVDSIDLKEQNYRAAPFVSARDCLASLKTSINNLNKKKLFPYNPQVLLRRLMTFEELCAVKQ